MYAYTEVAIKLADGITPAFKCNIDVKQSCVLSTTLFKMFISDLPAELKQGHCDPVTLLHRVINCLIFADDVIIISESEDSLKKALKVIQQYCSKWLLNINLDKIKIMVFTKSEQMVKHVNVKFGNNGIEIVKMYIYLGIVFTSNGSFNMAIKTLSKKHSKLCTS